MARDSGAFLIERNESDLHLILWIFSIVYYNRKEECLAIK